METLEKPKATGGSSNSSDTNKWYCPKNKRIALSYQDEGVRIGLDNGLSGSLLNFLQTLGADNEIPEDYAAQRGWLNHFHQQVAVNNPLWPEDMDFEFVYRNFVNAVMYNRVGLKGHNVHAFITAFRDWITQSGVEHSLREKWNRMNPEKKPEQLSETSQSNRVEGRPNDCFDWPPEEVKKTYQQYINLPFDWQEMVDRGGYAAKLERTRKHLEEQGEW